MALILVALASTALVRARFDAGLRSQSAHQKTSAIALAQELTHRFRASAMDELAAVEADPYWETISGCDKPCEFVEDGLPRVADSRLEYRDLAYCLASNDDSFKVTVLWRYSQGVGCDGPDRVELRAPTAVL